MDNNCRLLLYVYNRYHDAVSDCFKFTHADVCNTYDRFCDVCSEMLTISGDEFIERLCFVMNKARCRTLQFRIKIVRALYGNFKK